MPARPFVSFAEVKEKLRIAEVLEALGLLHGFARRGETLTGCCPLPAHVHGPAPNPEQFKVHRRNGIDLWYCFGDCGKGGDVIALIKELTGYDNAHARLWIAQHFGDRLTLKKPAAPRQATGPPNEEARPSRCNESNGRAKCVAPTGNGKGVRSIQSVFGNVTALVDRGCATLHRPDAIIRSPETIRTHDPNGM